MSELISLEKESVDWKFEKSSIKSDLLITKSDPKIKVPINGSIIDLSFSPTQSGINSKINGKEFSIKLPANVWQDYPCKDTLIDNIAYETALLIPIFMHIRKNKLDKIALKNSYPLFKNMLFQNALNLIPNSASCSNASAFNWVRELVNSDIEFSDYNTKYPEINCNYEEKAIINFTFGKESLLTFALCGELDIPTHLIYTASPEEKVETYYKSLLSKKLRVQEKNQNFEYTTIHDDLCYIYCSHFWGLPELEWGNDLVTFNTFLSLPFAHQFNSKYIMFGNEKSCDDSYTTLEGVKTYPSSDQTSKWGIELKQMVARMTNKEATFASIVEPLNEMAVMKVLHNRYPQISRFQMSCFIDDKMYKQGGNRWCCACSKCARIFLLASAVGIDPKSFSLRPNMFEKKYKNLFSLFGTNEDALPFDRMGIGIEEQLFAFYLSYQNGAKGELIDLFKKNYLAEAQVREDEFYKKFLGIHKSITIPKELKESVYSIFREELSD